MANLPRGWHTPRLPKNSSLQIDTSCCVRKVCHPPRDRIAALRWACSKSLVFGRSRRGQGLPQRRAWRISKSRRGWRKRSRSNRKTGLYRLVRPKETPWARTVSSSQGRAGGTHINIIKQFDVGESFFQTLLRVSPSHRSQPKIGQDSEDYRHVSAKNATKGGSLTVPVVVRQR